MKANPHMPGLHQTSLASSGGEEHQVEEEEEQEVELEEEQDEKNGDREEVDDEGAPVGWSSTFCPTIC